MTKVKEITRNMVLTICDNKATWVKLTIKNIILTKKKIEIIIGNYRQ